MHLSPAAGTHQPSKPQQLLLVIVEVRLVCPVEQFTVLQYGVLKARADQSQSANMFWPQVARYSSFFVVNNVIPIVLSTCLGFFVFLLDGDDMEKRLSAAFCFLLPLDVAFSLRMATICLLPALYHRRAGRAGVSS